jgi:crotonobetainyl-CoA:carnitine CoA-transferase CaiB-like acyl-CoA transferase
VLDLFHLGAPRLRRVAAALCELIGRPELTRDPRCATMRTRAAHAAELVPEIAVVVSKLLI